MPSRGALTGNVDRFEIFEYFDSADDRTVRIVNRNRSHPDWDLVSALVMQEPHGFYRFARFYGLRLSAVFTAELASRLAAMQQRFGDTGVPHDFVAKSTRDAFRTIAPKNNFFLHVKYAQSGWEAFQNVATNLELVESGHAIARWWLRGSSAGNRRDFNRFEPPGLGWLQAIVGIRFGASILVPDPDLQRPYVPMHSACARMCPFIAASSCFLVEFGSRSSLLSSANNLK